MIVRKSPQEIEKMRVSGRIAAEVLAQLRDHIQPGILTIELDRLASELIDRHKAKPAFLGYRGFPGNICVSINEEVVHGIPGGRPIRSGDIVSIDLGICFDGFFGDCAVTVPAGKIDAEKECLIQVTEESLNQAIEKARPGNRLFDISHAVQSQVERCGFSVVRDFVGHGIGREMHEDPQIPNFGPPHRGPRLEEGMVLAIEPMVNMGSFQVKVLEDGWTVVTEDGLPSAHFEHTVAILGNGPEILTKIS